MKQPQSSEHATEAAVLAKADLQEGEVGAKSDAASISPYLYYLIFMLFMANMFNQMDRTVLSVLIEPIRQDLSLTDNQIGSLGFAFAIFYATFGLFIGRLTDTHSRSKLLSIAIGVFSTATVVCGWVQNYVQLFIARVVVGAGEAGGVPTSYSIVGDSFRPEHRASALALVYGGVAVGSAVGLILAGVLADAVGWRMTFVLFGIPGLLLALGVWFTVKEPLRGRFEGAEVQAAEAPSLVETIRTLSGNRTFIFITFAYSISLFCMYGIGYWLPSYLIRSLGMSLTQVGLIYGPIVGLTMAVGLIVSAVLVPKLLKADRRWELWLPGAMNALAAVCYVALFTAQTLLTAIVFASMASFLIGITVGPASAGIQSTVTARKRGVAVAVVMFVSALFGQGLGPWLIGIASDMLASAHGEDSLRIALRYSPIVFLIGSLFYYLGGRSFNSDRVD
ncbi:MAG: MFS transporter [Pseudomonadota bacterium]